MAQVLTYPERVTDHNIETLRRAVANGVPACSAMGMHGIKVPIPHICCLTCIKPHGRHVQCYPAPVASDVQDLKRMFGGTCHRALLPT